MSEKVDKVVCRRCRDFGGDGYIGESVWLCLYWLNNRKNEHLPKTTNGNLLGVSVLEVGDVLPDWCPCILEHLVSTQGDKPIVKQWDMEFDSG